MSETIKQLNWVDIFVLILLFRICYIAFVKGLAIEFFKLLGTVFALYLAFHYYSTWARTASERLGLQSVPLSSLEFISFIALAAIGYVMFIFARLGVGKFMQTETVPLLDKWGGLILGIGRGVVLLAMFMFVFAASSFDYLKTSVEKSHLGGRIFYIGPSMYAAMWNGLLSKFAPQENLNKNVEEINKSFKP